MSEEKFNPKSVVAINENMTTKVKTLSDKNKSMMFQGNRNPIEWMYPVKLFNKRLEFVPWIINWLSETRK